MVRRESKRDIERKNTKVFLQRRNLEEGIILEYRKYG